MKADDIMSMTLCSIPIDKHALRTHACSTHVYTAAKPIDVDTAVCRQSLIPSVSLFFKDSWNAWFSFSLDVEAYFLVHGAIKI